MLQKEVKRLGCFRCAETKLLIRLKVTIVYVVTYYEVTQLCRESFCLLGIESHFVGVYGPYELHRKEKQLKCTALAVHEHLLFFPMQFIWPVNTDKMRFNTYIYIF